jgi:hypothetical protein
MSFKILETEAVKHAIDVADTIAARPGLDASDRFLRDTTPDRPPVASRVRAGLQEALEWTRRERRLCGSEQVGGEWVEAEDTGPEFLAGRVKEVVDKYKVIP